MVLYPPRYTSILAGILSFCKLYLWLIPCRYREIREEENKNVPEGQTKASVYGATLLSGILYCGHCGCKLVGGYCVKHRKNGPYHRPIYRCYNGAVKAKQCDGQTVYSAMQIEEAVLEVVHGYFNRMKGTVDSIWAEQARRQLRSKANANVRQLQATLAQERKHETVLQAEVVKVLTGESAFAADTLAKMLEDTKQKISDA